MTRRLLTTLTLSLMLLAPGPARTLAQEATPAATLDPVAFSPVVTHPYFPLGSVTWKVLEGDFVDGESGDTVHERVEERVLPDTKTIAGIEVTVVEVNEYVDGELAEHTLDYYAQQADGTVYYLGEDVDNYEDGVLVDHEGAWKAGDGDNQPGIFLPASPEVGMVFEQERAPGIAEDRSTVIEVDLEVVSAAGWFSGCIKTEDVNPLDDTTEFKWYCPGVGIVGEESEDGALELVAFSGGQQEAPAATPVD